MSPEQGQTIETVRLNAGQRRQLIERMRQRGGRPPALERRALRVEFPLDRLIVTVTQPNNHSVVYAVIPRDLSRRGLGFIHGRFIYVDSPVEVLLPTLQQKWVAVTGRTIACRHLSGLLHEVSVVFDQPVQLTDHVLLTPEQAQQLRREVRSDPQALDELEAARMQTVNDAPGRALLVSDIEADCRLMTLWLSQIGYEVTVAGGSIPGLAAQVRANPPQVVLVDLTGELKARCACIEHLRHGLGYHGPILAMSADERGGPQRQALASGANRFLTRPFGQACLQNAIHQIQNPDGAIISALSGDVEMRPLIQSFVNTISDYAAELAQAVQQKDHDRTHRLCQVIKSTGSGYGFDPLTQMARRAMEALEARALDLNAIRQRVEDLIDTIRRVQFH